MDAFEVRLLAERHYGDEFSGEQPDAPMFALLVDVADAYVKELEKQAGMSPAPFFAGSTPMEAAMNGLAENLEMIREPHLIRGTPIDRPDDDDPTS